jgi:outer membrane protein W
MQDCEKNMKVFIIYLLIVCTLPCFAQSAIQSRTININGSLSFSSQTSEGENESRNVLSLNPQVGYFIFDNISLNLSLNYYRDSYNQYSITEWGIGPIIRYYLGNEKIKFFPLIGYLYSEQIQSNTYASLLFPGNESIFGGGVNYFVTNNIAIETTVIYKILKLRKPNRFIIDYPYGYPNNSKVLFIGLGINIFL